MKLKNIYDIQASGLCGKTTGLQDSGVVIELHGLN